MTPERIGAPPLIFAGALAQVSSILSRNCEAEEPPRLPDNTNPEIVTRCIRKPHIEDLHVEVLTKTPVRSVDHEGVAAGDQRIPSANILWCAGTMAAPGAG